MQNGSKNDATFETCLFNHCANGKTGTVLIATNNNKSCQIIIKNGDIVAATMARVKGYKAIKELMKVGFKRASFTPDLQLPFSEDARIKSSKDLLTILGYDRKKTSSMDSTDTKNTEEILEPIDKKPKSQRVYRGQIIDD